MVGPRRIVRIEAPARLHLGFLDPDASRARRFGGIGLALEGISTIVDALPYATLDVSGEDSARALACAQAVLAHDAVAPAIKLEVVRAIPAHAGLGSGTQLALAIGAAIRASHARQAVPVELARLLGRARRSGVGLALFEHGGLVVDGGHGAATQTPPLLSRAAFPSAWRCVLVFDHACAGLSGGAERAAFGALSPLARTQAATLCHITLLQLLPAVIEQDFAVFSAALAEIQTIVGDHFAPIQGGRFASGRVREALEFVQARHALGGIGQSSWGPTGFVFTPSADVAETVCAALRARYADLPTLEFRICAGRNRGADLSLGAHATALRRAGT